MKKFFLSIPHSGTEIPPEILPLINPEAHLQEITEPGIPNIFDWPEIPKVIASHHQCFPNLNRPKDNINPNTDEEYPQERALFPTLDFQDTPLYLTEPSGQIKNELLTKYYDPYFAKLSELTASHDFFIDCHAMNNQNSSYAEDGDRPDICLGNRGGALGRPRPDRPGITFPTAKLQRIQRNLQELGYKTTLNEPFSGGYIIRKFGHQNFPCFQIEINKKLYMTADSGQTITEKIAKLSKDLQQAITHS